MLMIYVSRRHWLKKRQWRVRDELRFTERIISKEGLRAHDWARAMFQARSMQLLCGDLCPYRMAILGAILVDKEVCESTNYLKITVDLRGK